MWPHACRWCRVVVVFFAALLGSTARAQTLTLPTVLDRVAEYVDRFVVRFAGVVLEERYRQDVLGGGTTSPAVSRRLRSDILFVADDTELGGSTVRDVLEVDGVLIPNHQDRLAALFARPAAATRAQAERIAAENARYNLGPLDRTTNTPELAVLFLRRVVQRRFRFAVAAREDGGRIWQLSFEERTRPTIVRKERNRDLPASGRVWVETATGTITQTLLTLRPTGGDWQVTTTFAMDPRAGIALPSAMDERLNVDRLRLHGAATYSNVRIFQVKASETTTAP